VQVLQLGYVGGDLRHVRVMITPGTRGDGGRGGEHVTEARRHGESRRRAVRSSRRAQARLGGGVPGIASAAERFSRLRFLACPHPDAGLRPAREEHSALSSVLLRASASP
jgi:hypothetical protein